MTRIDMHRLQEMVRLHRMGSGARKVAQLLVMSPNTERAYRRALAAAGLLEVPPMRCPSSGNRDPGRGHGVDADHS